MKESTLLLVILLWLSFLGPFIVGIFIVVCKIANSLIKMYPQR